MLLLLAGLAASPSVAAEREVGDARALAAAVRAARPGDVVVMSDGVWRDADLVLEANATAENPVTVRARTPGRVVVAGRSQLRMSGTGLVVDGLWFKDGQAARSDVVAFRTSSRRLAHHCRLTRCAIDAYNPDRKDAESKWVSIYGTDNRVDHCEFSGKTNAGTTLVVWVGDGPGRHRVDHNRFGPRPRLGANGGETIRVGTSDRSAVAERSVVESNLFEECNGEVEIVSNKSCENTYRNNLFRGCEGALTLRHGDRCTVEGNVFLGLGKKNTGGVRVIGEDHRVYNNYFEGLTGTTSRSALCLMNGIPDSPAAGYAQVKRAVVVFNTFVDCRSPFLVGHAGDDPKTVSLPPEDCTIADNVVVRGGDPTVRVATAPRVLNGRGNVAFATKSGADARFGFRAIDPLLSKGADGLWRPASGSPLTGAAHGDFPFVADDLDGQPRGPAKDVGCDQRSADPVRRALPTRQSVGPGWMGTRLMRPRSPM